MTKKKCCEGYKKKGKNCKNCPLVAAGDVGLILELGDEKKKKKKKKSKKKDKKKDK